MLLQVVGVVSVALLFFVALAAIETFTDELMPQLKFKQIYIILLTVLITGVGMQLAMSVLMVLLPASIT
ncbi:hypothetical protein [Bacterioplanoides pacificum]|uniref:Uncharacterized protein n=1 Tax=Bacterioplanoides pacificum TaxID=1171596 RepID=A0ABV7VTH2_9GAMM